MLQSPSEKARLQQITFLKSVSIFQELNEDELTMLVNDFRLKKYGKNEIVFHQGGTSKELYIIRSGKVRIYRISPAGDETSIIVFGCRDVIGEFSIIDGKPRSATARTIGPVTLLQLAEATFWQRVYTMPGLALGLTRLLVNKLRWTAAYAEAVAQYDAAGRLLHILLKYNEQFGREIVAGQRYELDLALNQTDLASLVGSRREWINRKLSEWSDHGLIEYNRGKIIILDLAKVQAERDSRIEANVADW